MLKVITYSVVVERISRLEQEGSASVGEQGLLKAIPKGSAPPDVTWTFII
jgi:hypothetical protein